MNARAPHGATNAGGPQAPADPPAAQRPRVPRFAATAAVALAACATLPWLVHPWYEASRETHDAALYILCAKSLLAGEGYRYLGEPFVVRPPGFSVLIAPILWLRGVDFQALNVYVSLFGAAAIVLYFAFYRARVGALVAAAIALWAWLNPSFRQLCNQAMSDVPALALLFACLLLERRARRSPSWRADAALGLAIGVSAYVRTSLALLAPAVVAARLVEHFLERRAARRQGAGHAPAGHAPAERPPLERAPWTRAFAPRALLLLVAPTILLAPWSARNAASHPAWPAEQTLLADYSTAMWHTDAGDPGSPRVPIGAVLGRAAVHGPELLRVLGGRVRLESGGAVTVVMGGATLAAIAFIFLRRRRPAEAYALVLAGVYLFYFASDDRLVLPIWLLGLGAVAECAVLVLSRFVPPRLAQSVAAAALALAGVLDAEPRRGWSTIESEFRAKTELAADWNQRIPAGASVASPIGWHWSVLLGRPVWSLYFAARRAGGMPGAEEILRRRRVEYVVLQRNPPDDEVMLAWFLQHYQRSEQGETGVLFRVPR